jgi:Zn-dependent protease
MNSDVIIDGLIDYLCLLIVLTFHEFAHAWTAWKCGDDTARLQGRVSLNPLVHMELVGTVILPLAIMFLSASGSSLGRFLIGWGKPVPVNPGRLRNRRVQDTLISVAGPAMNLVLALGVMLLAKGFALADLSQMVGVMLRMAQISLVLCFFNLLPIPPLDGSHVLKNAIGMGEEAYLYLCRFGFILVIVAIQIPPVLGLVRAATLVSLDFMARLVRLA